VKKNRAKNCPRDIQREGLKNKRFSLSVLSPPGLATENGFKAAKGDKIVLPKRLHKREPR